MRLNFCFLEDGGFVKILRHFNRKFEGRRAFAANRSNTRLAAGLEERNNTIF